jgi:hypothetical protein
MQRVLVTIAMARWFCLPALQMARRMDGEEGTDNLLQVQAEDDRYGRNNLSG